MRAKRNPQYDEMFLGGLVDRAKGFAEKRPGMAKAIGIGGGMLLNKAIGNKGAGLFSKMSGAGLVDMLRDRLQQRKDAQSTPEAEYGAKVKEYGQGGVMKYRKGGMIYAQDSDQLTGDEAKEKEKTFVKSNYGSGEDRITERDIKAHPSLDPYTTIHASGYGRVPRKMDTPGYFLIPGYTDEQRQKDIEAGRKLRDEQKYILEVMPDGSKRTISFYDIGDEFTTGEEGETRADILEAMDIGITRTDEGFTLPSTEKQVRRLMDMRENYGLGDVTFKALQKELGLDTPMMDKGEYRDSLERALERRTAGQVALSRASGQR